MVKQTNSNKDYNTAEFMFDSADELSNLPTDDDQPEGAEDGSEEE